MKIYLYTCGLVIIALLMVGAQSGFTASLSDMAKEAQKALGGSAGGLSNDEITAGLKEALQVGTDKAVSLVSQPDGFFKNPAIK
ncbi:MAG: DUF4197 domain-containing protein, partial [Deltaproteobacteria bacterium]|nr:DUF4197 domain-containing protein [Deltaproteobacteria bacterium]